MSDSDIFYEILCVCGAGFSVKTQILHMLGFCEKVIMRQFTANR